MESPEDVIGSRCVDHRRWSGATCHPSVRTRFESAIGPKFSVSFRSRRNRIGVAYNSISKSLGIHRS